jgi:hypothetical protein
MLINMAPLGRRKNLLNGLDAIFIAVLICIPFQVFINPLQPLFF